MSEEQFQQCAQCAQTVFTNTLEDGLCETCRQKTCVSCDKTFDINDGRIFKDNFWCDDCFSEDHCFCDKCGEAVCSDDTQEITVDRNTETWCSDCAANCAFRCVDCGNYFPERQAYFVPNGDTICESCYSENYFVCENCDETYSNDYYGENGYCRDCAQPEEDSNGLHDYDYKPYPEFHGKSESGLFFGIELEIESCGNDIADAVDCMPEFVYCKHDGSLSDGLEVVSHPASWQWLHDYKDKWEQILKLGKQGFRSYDTDTCGMHVHLSRDAFSSLHLYKFLKLFYENPEFILTVSRRKKSNLDQYASLTTDESIVVKAKKGTCVRRYTAVNLQNRYTIEVRVFRGTLVSAGFWRNVEFCKAAYEFTKTVGIQQVTQQNFCQYVQNNKKEYPNLSTFLEAKNYVHCDI